MMNDKSDDKVTKITNGRWHLWDISEKDWWIFETDYTHKVEIENIMKSTGAKEYTVEITDGFTDAYAGKPVMRICLR